MVIKLIELLIFNIYFKNGYIRCLFSDLWGNFYLINNFGWYEEIDIFLLGLDREIGIDDDIGNWFILFFEIKKDKN